MRAISFLWSMFQSYFLYGFFWGVKGMDGMDAGMGLAQHGTGKRAKRTCMMYDLCAHDMMAREVFWIDDMGRNG